MVVAVNVVLPTFPQRSPNPLSVFEGVAREKTEEKDRRERDGDGRKTLPNKFLVTAFDLNILKVLLFDNSVILNIQQHQHTEAYTVTFEQSPMVSVVI